jgi:hypothetical protein
VCERKREREREREGGRERWAPVHAEVTAKIQ